MRSIVRSQTPLVVQVNHPFARELAQISALIDGLPREALEAVHADIVAAGGDPDKGREGMSAEQVVRATIVKQMTTSSYDELAFHLQDSWTYRAFCRVAMGESIAKSTLQKNIKCVRPETWERINRLLVKKAQQSGIEVGKKTRTDCTVVETNIHEPSDSSLLWDCVRVLCRLMTKAKESFGISFCSRRRRAKRRAMGILNAKSMAQRVPLYRDLLKVTQETMGQASEVVARLREVECGGVHRALVAMAIEKEIEQVLELTSLVVRQTERRVLQGEAVAATEKIVSIFEPHTDIIIKDRRDTHYGHKVCLTTGASGMILDMVVEDGNPADSTLASRMITRVKGLFGQAPRQAAFDGGFSSKANVPDIREIGVQDVVFSKHVGLEISDMARSEWVFKKLRNFRAGIEAGISWIKRVFGLTRCTWKGETAFKSYVWASTVAFNLLVFARRLLPSS
jgi:IS5 family transposase